MERLAQLIAKRNEIELEAFEILNRPFEIGNIGEYIASNVFNIELNKSASEKGHDGIFRDGILAGKNVNVKFYSKQSNILDLNDKHKADYYLVFCGNSKNGINQWAIESVHLFEANLLISKLKTKNVRIGIATSIVKSLWIENEIYPQLNNQLYLLSEEQKRKIELFKSK